LPDDAAYLEADQADAHTALAGAAGIITSGQAPAHDWEDLATKAYRWLRSRDSLRAVRVALIPGEARKEGSPMTTTYDLSDTDEVEFTLTGLDAKGASVPLDAGFTAAWTLADPDSTGATLTVSADTTNATVAAGVPDSNLLLSVTVTNPDGSALTGAEAIIVQATAATTVGLVAGTPVPES
jgi:hypothetical protein